MDMNDSYLWLRNLTQQRGKNDGEKTFMNHVCKNMPKPNSFLGGYVVGLRLMDRLQSLLNAPARLVLAYYISQRCRPMSSDVVRRRTTSCGV